MRAIDNVTAIEEAAGKIKAPASSSNPARTSPVFQPTPDGVTVFDDYVARYKNGNFSRLVRSSFSPLLLLYLTPLYIFPPPPFPLHTTLVFSSPLNPYN